MRFPRCGVVPQIMVGHCLLRPAPLFPKVTCQITATTIITTAAAAIASFFLSPAHEGESTVYRRRELKRRWSKWGEEKQEEKNGHPQRGYGGRPPKRRCGLRHTSDGRVQCRHGMVLDSIIVDDSLLISLIVDHTLSSIDCG